MPGDAYIRVTVDADAEKLISVERELGRVGSAADKTGASLAKIAVGSASAQDGISRFKNATAAARVEMGALDGSTGMMLGGLARMAGQSAALAPLVASAFPIIGAVGLIEVVSSAGEGITKLYDRFVTLKAEEDEVTAATKKLSESTYQYQQAAMHAGEATLGMLAGPVAEARAKLSDLASTIVPIKIEDEKLKALPTEIQEMVAKLKSAPGQMGIPVTQIEAAMSRISEQIKNQQKIAEDARKTTASGFNINAGVGNAAGEAEAASAELNARLLKGVLADLTAAQQEYAARVTEAQAGVFRAQQTENEKALKSGLAADKERFTAQEQADLKSIEQSQLALQAKFAAKQISSNQEIEQLLALDARKAEIEKASDARAEITKRAEQVIRDEKEEMASTERLTRADIEFFEKKMRATSELTLAELHGIEIVASAQAKADEAAMNRKLEAKQISPAQAADGLRTARADEFNTAATAQQGRIDAEIDPAKKKDMQAFLKAMEIQFVSDMEKIDDDSNRRTESEQMQSIDRTVTATMEGANRELEASMRMDDDRLRHREASLNQTVSAERSALDKWLADQLTALKIALDFAEANGGKEGADYQRLIQKKEALDRQYETTSMALDQKLANGSQQVVAKMQNDFNSAFVKIALGEETLGQASKQVFDEMAGSFISNSAKMIEQEIVQAVMHKSLLKGEILGDAKAAAAGAYKAMAGIPIIGPELGAVAAAVTFGAVMAFGSFETGGIARSTGPYILHEGEGVMTRRQTEAINRAGNVTNNNSGGSRFHTTVHIHHNGTNLSEYDITKAVTRGVRKGTLRVG